MTTLKLGDTISIGGKEYTIGSTTDNVKASVANAIVGQTVTIDGISYTVAASGKSNKDKNELDTDDLQDMVGDGSTVVYQGKKLVSIMDSTSNTAITADDGDQDQYTDYTDNSVVTKGQAYQLIENELKLASSVGATNAKAGVHTTYAVDATNNKVTYVLDKGTVNKKENMQFSLHVGADADGTNKINVSLAALTAEGLGIDGINVKDTTGANATYAIDAIADAIAKVSQQRSTLGAVQNRLEHTINNLDNVVENTTAAESQIRDTDMATEMVRYSNSNILAQAGQAMLAQANQSNQGVLSLLG
jgi:flagellin